MLYVPPNTLQAGTKYLVSLTATQSGIPTVAETTFSTAYPDLVRIPSPALMCLKGMRAQASGLTGKRAAREDLKKVCGHGRWRRSRAEAE